MQTSECTLKNTYTHTRYKDTPVVVSHEFKGWLVNKS